MARLIDADKYMETARSKLDMQDLYLPVTIKDFVIDKMPTVDAVSVVRCKDCKYYQHGRNADDWLWCMMNHHYTDEEKYCAWAERKEE